MKFRVYFAISMSGVMSLLMSAWITFINIGMNSAYLQSWLEAWCLAWPVAGLVAFTFGPVLQKLSKKLAG